MLGQKVVMYTRNFLESKFNETTELKPLKLLVIVYDGEENRRPLPMKDSKDLRHVNSLQPKESKQSVERKSEKTMHGKGVTTDGTIDKRP